MEDRIKFSNAQMQEYYDRIKLPPQDRLILSEGIRPAFQLAVLKRLQKHHICTIPFENLTLHYSWHRVIHVDPQHLFEKMVRQRRGGYCMENNTLFHTVLLTLGFDVYMAGARVYKQDEAKYSGYEHCLNIVTIGDLRYAVDVGFGSNGPLEPLPMTNGSEQDNIAPNQVRLRYDTIRQGLNTKGQYWIYELRINELSDWETMYCFTDTEFLPVDIRVINLSASQSPTSLFVKKILCTRFVTGKEDVIYDDYKVEEVSEGNITGVFILDDNTVSLRRAGTKVWRNTFPDENERVRYLSSIFGIDLDQMDRNAIRGRVTEVKALA